MGKWTLGEGGGSPLCLPPLDQAPGAFSTAMEYSLSESAESRATATYMSTKAYLLRASGR